MSETKKLRSRITKLEQQMLEQHQQILEQHQQILDLKRQLALAAGRRVHWMRDNRRRPAGDGDRLLPIPAATELGRRGATPLAVVHESGFFGSTGKGPVEHYICRRCHLIESHVIDLDGIEPDRTSVIALEPAPELEPSGGPFR